MSFESDYNNVMQNGGYKVLDKTVLRVHPTPWDFLNGITTNTEQSNTNAFLDRFGKTVAVFDQKVLEKEAFIVIESFLKDRLRTHLRSYLMLSGTKLDKTELKAVHVIGDAKLDGISIPQRVGTLWLTEKIDPKLKEISDEAYTAIRLESDIAIQGIDFDEEMILNTNCGDAVSYKKGCYVGQEIVAKVHNLSEAPKKLIRIAYENRPGEEVISDGKPIGKITTKAFSPKHEKYLAFAMIPRDVETIDGGKILE